MIKVGSRDSRLAVVQAEEVMRRLGECELVTMKTTGDKILDRTLDKVGGKGLFVKELDRALAAGEVDLTVAAKLVSQAFYGPLAPLVRATGS